MDRMIVGDDGFRRRGAAPADEDRSGYRHVAASRPGYTAITSGALRALRLRRLYPRCGLPSHLLVELNDYGFLGFYVLHLRLYPGAPRNRDLR